jgi:Zn-dependent metalloprotease
MNDITRNCLLTLGLVCACSTKHSADIDLSNQNHTPAQQQTITLESFADVRRDPVSGTVIFAKADDLAVSLVDDPEYQALSDDKAYAEMTLRFLETYRDDFRLINPSTEFVAKRSTRDTLGYRHVQLKQVFEGLAVVDAELSVQFDPYNNLNLIQGRYVPTPGVDPASPRYSGSDAHSFAKDALGADFEFTEPELVIFPRSDGSSVLAYQTTATRGLAQGWRLVIDANDGSILLKVPTRYTN